MTSKFLRPTPGGAMERLASLEARAEAAEARLDRLEQRQDRQEEGHEGHEERLVAQEEMTRVLREEMDRIGAAVDGLRADLRDRYERAVDLESQRELAHSKRFEDMTNRITRLERVTLASTSGLGIGIGGLLALLEWLSR